MKPQKILPLLLILALCVGLCGFTGCESTPGERVAAVKATLDQAAGVNQSIDSGIAEIEKVVADSQALLADPNIPPEMRPEIEAVLSQASAKLVKLKTEKQKVVDVIAKYQQLLNSVDTNNLTADQEAQLYATGAGQAAQFLPQPYRSYVYLGIVLVPLITSILKNINQAKQINQGKKVLTEVVASVDKVLESEEVAEDVDGVKQILQKNQSGATQDIVDSIHDPQKNTGPTK